jgi:hypothetical protein
MTERTAANLVLTALLVVLLASCFVLKALHASDDAMVVAYLVVLSVGGLSSGRIAVHYSEKRPSERERR